MNTPILHSRTQQKINLYLRQPFHGLLLTGSKGVGKTFIAEWISAQLNKEVLLIQIPADKTGITIEQIRSLYNLTQTGNDVAVIIEYADTMGEAAQNAFLKLLEEPPENVFFILTARNANSLLATIQSRTQHIEILAPTFTQLQSDERTKHLPAALLHTSEGKAGTLFTLLADEEQKNQHEEIVAQAKKFYADKPFERHLACISLNFEKEKLQSLINMLAIVIQTLIKHTNDPAAHKKLIVQAKLVEQTAQNIFGINGNPKIHITKLCQEL